MHLPLEGIIVAYAVTPAPISTALTRCRNVEEKLQEYPKGKDEPCDSPLDTLFAILTCNHSRYLIC